MNAEVRSRGCLIMRVRGSTDLYRQIAGWYGGIVETIGGSAKGRPLGFGPRNEGSNPSPPAICSSEVGNSATLFEPKTPYLAARTS